MSAALFTVADEHQARLLATIDGIPALADRLIEDPPVEVGPQLAALGAFLAGTLLPHMDAAERALYPELERLLQNRHSMSPMRREHDRIRRLVGESTRLAAECEAQGRTLGRTLALRRTLFQLYSILKVHLAEERAYLAIIQRGVDEVAAEDLGVALAHPVAG